MSQPELVVGSLRGYRWWKLDQEGWLSSPWRGRQLWLPGINRASCLFRKRITKWRSSKKPHPFGTPARACECGFYGLHAVPPTRTHPARFGWEIGVESSGDRSHGLVFGVAAAEGRVVVGTDGWRAEVARPLALLWGSGVELDRRAALNAQLYSLPMYRHLSALVTEWGPSETERDLAEAA